MQQHNVEKSKQRNEQGGVNWHREPLLPKETAGVPERLKEFCCGTKKRLAAMASPAREFQLAGSPQIQQRQIAPLIRSLSEGTCFHAGASCCCIPPLVSVHYFTTEWLEIQAIWKPGEAATIIAPPET